MAGLTVATVLRAGGEYRPEHVARLRDQVARHSPAARFVCLSDQQVECERVPLLHDWPGWWAKIELFRPGAVPGPCLYLDLDTDVVGPVDDLVGERFTMLSDFYRPDLPASGVMAWPATPPAHLYELFRRDAGRHMRACRTRERWGDQGFIGAHLGGEPLRFGPEVVSYKVHVRGRGVPAGARVVAYHGRPKPWEIAA